MTWRARSTASQHQEYPRLRTLVVDNAPSDDRTRRLVSELARTREIDYVIEPRPGLSWARNRAIDASDSEIIAWADDDEVCDAWWAAEIARAFVEVPGGRRGHRNRRPRRAPDGVPGLV